MSEHSGLLGLLSESDSGPTRCKLETEVYGLVWNIRTVTTRVCLVRGFPEFGSCAPYISGVLVLWTALLWPRRLIDEGVSDIGCLQPVGGQEGANDDPLCTYSGDPHPWRRVSLRRFLPNWLLPDPFG
jgi:hypothetical protein